MFARILALVVALGITCTACAADRPITIEDVNADPDKFVGKIFVFEKVDVLGEAAIAPNRYRFNVRTSAGKLFKDTRQPGQKLLFFSKDKGEAIKKYVESLQPGVAYTVNLTVMIEKEEGLGPRAVITEITKTIYKFDPPK